MERRLLTFIVSSTAFFLVYMTLRAKFAPQPAPAPAAAIVDEAENLVVDPAAPVEKPDATGIETDDSVADGQKFENSESESERSTQPEWITLGSMAAQSNYYMLVTINTRGGGIERIELTERDEGGKLRYHRVDTREGYLGYLAAEAATSIDGVTVNVVGPGTPAEIAGLQVGDIITSVGGRSVTNRQSLQNALVDSVPGDSIDIEVVRQGGTSPMTLPAVLSEYPLDIVRLAKDGGADQVEGNLSRSSCLMSLSQVNRKSIGLGETRIAGYESPSELVWSVADPVEGESPAGQSLNLDLELSASEMQAIGGKPVRLRRSYAISPKDYSIDMTLQVDNLADDPQDLAYRIEGPNGLTLEGWWYSNKISPNFSGAAARDVIYKTAAEGHELISGYNLLKTAKKTPANPYEAIFAPDREDAARSLNYIGVDAQYFAVAFIPPTNVESLTTFRRAVAGVVADPLSVPKHKERAVNASFVLDSVVATVPAGGSLRQEMQLFAGPKDPAVLEPYGLGQFVYYGWFERFAKLLGKLLHVLSGVGNYALAIILLTVIVRAAMFPLSRKAAVNAQKMQELAPELKKITEQYKDDMEGRMKAQRELQKRVGFNPMAGCLPMFLQLPIFIGLYRALSVDIELRQQPVFSGWDWASNLAGPDMFAYWGDWMMDYFAGRGTGWLGPYFNILPVIVVGLFLAQQKMFMPPATDEQTAMTQKMMNIMTLMMGLFFFRVPAGLCIYFITSSLWGIGERILVKKTLPTKSHFDAAVLEGSAVPKGSKPADRKETLADKIKNAVNKPEPTFDRPNKRKRPKK
ncbi:Membrane protein insertase YidC [Rubripirellula tenax]|uniref:Membrane protein insertase YidC n=1 Tax=Rubripirellula tenax TaxID=2528015 RepID=A0A5C6EFR3_9BACT|nr:YidC/Oxa1 family insertase periplasmic-domain containing protein [Rubripirellula tenax]TWU47628.1 Membrane protein insertase YidC [Rubripirellula tenax]